jgi:hypothetical protein
MEQSPSWEANRSSATQEIPSILWNTNVHYRIYNNPPTCPYPEPDQSSPCPHPTYGILKFLWVFHTEFFYLDPFYENCEYLQDFVNNHRVTLIALITEFGAERGVFPYLFPTTQHGYMQHLLGFTAFVVSLQQQLVLACFSTHITYYKLLKQININKNITINRNTTFILYVIISWNLKLKGLSTPRKYQSCQQLVELHVLTSSSS